MISLIQLRQIPHPPPNLPLEGRRNITISLPFRGRVRVGVGLDGLFARVKLNMAVSSKKRFE
jgi:hypothetical protein